VILVKGSNHVEVENYANIETQKAVKWARDNKMRFNGQKPKIMIITKKRPKNRRNIKIFLNNKILKQADTINYLGITIDRRLNFNHHIDKIMGKSIKIVHAISRSAKNNWGLRHDVLRIIYTGVILPILSYGAPVWIECLKKKHNALKLKRVQRLTNIKLAQAYRTTSYETLCVLTGMTPILIELESQAKIYHNTRGNEKGETYDALKHCSQWNHPADALELKEKRKEREYTMKVYTDGSKHIGGVGSGIAVFENNQMSHQILYKLADECSKNQAEQLAIVKALEKLKDFSHLKGPLRTAAVHTDNKITLDAIAKPRNHQHLIELIGDELRRLEKDNWSIHFTWLKARNDYVGNEIADLLTKKAAGGRDGKTACSRIPKSAVIKLIQKKGELQWQSEWNVSTKGK